MKKRSSASPHHRAGTPADFAVLADRVCERIESLRDEVVATNRWLYEHPELSGVEHESSKYLGNRASAHGFSVEWGVAGLPTAFRAIRAGTGTGRRVAFLSEYDALPEVGHGCGHNFIGTASAYAAIGLACVADDIPGEILLFGTPAEETFGGKILMLEAGLFDGIDAALMVHPGSETKVAYPSRACMSAVIEFHGKAAHSAAAPWKGANALDAMIQLFVSFDLLRKQLPATAAAPGIILHGGERANMVPHYTKAQFSLRGKNIEEVRMVLDRLTRCAQAAALASGTTVTCRENDTPYFDMRPDPRLSGFFEQAWIDVGGEKPVRRDTPYGSLDIANLSHRFPCLHPSIRITPDDTVAGHSTEFATCTQTPMAQEQLLKAAKALALTGLQVLL